MRVRSALIIAGVAALAACETTAGPIIVPFARFTYTGAASGTFDVTGGPSANDTTQSFASAYRDAQFDSVVVVAQHNQGQTIDRLLVGFHTSGAGSFTLDSGCSGHAACGTVVLVRAAGTTGQMLCYLESGSLATTLNNPARVTGTFSGTGHCWDGGGAQVGTFTVTDGSFDVLITLGLNGS